MANVAQRSFAGGELAPSLYARTDLVKYQTGLRTCRNFLVQRHGGVATRPGTEYVAATKSASGDVRLFKFVFNDASASDVYVLEAGPLYLRFFQNGAPVTIDAPDAWATATAYAVGDLVATGGVNYYCTTAHTSGASTKPGTGADWRNDWYALTGSIYEIPTPYLDTDLAEIQWVQSADIITLVHPAYAPRELARYAHTRWTLTPIAFGPAIGTPTGLAAADGVAGTAYYAVTALDAATGEESLAATIDASGHAPSSGTPTTITWALVQGALEYNLYRSTDGQTFGYIGTAGGTPATATDSTWTTPSDTVTTGTKDSWVASGTQARNPLTLGATTKSATGKYAITGDLTVTALSGTGTPLVTDGRVRAYYSRDAEPRVDAGIIATARCYGEGGSGAVPFTGVEITVPDNGYTALTIDLVPEVAGSVETTGSATFSAEVDATSVRWSQALATFSDAAIAPDYGAGPPPPRTLFAGASDYPAAVGYYQQRRLFANTTNAPATVWASRTGLYTNFLLSEPLQDDDAVTFTLVGRQVNSVRHLLDLGRLVVFTPAGEWIIEGDQSGILAPAAVNPRQYSYAGAATLSPLVIADTALFVQARGTIVRDLRPDPIDGYRGNDLTVFAAHLFNGYSLTDWDFQQAPDSIIWAVRSDGTLLGLTYLPEQAVWGWHRHDTDGTIEHVCVVPEGSEDRPYLVVSRTVNGAAVRYIERLTTRYATDIRDQLCLDAALSFDGRNTGATTLTLSGGVSWDEGETLTLTASASQFIAGDVGNRYDLTAADGTALRCTVEAYTSATVVTVRPNRTVPADLQGAATTDWARAVDQVSGLDHLEGCAVAVTGDGYVVANPNDSRYSAVTVSGGVATLPEPYAVIHVGLPYVCDLQTLDLDTPQGASTKETKRLVARVGLYLESSRGVWVGQTLPDADDDQGTLTEMKSRSTEPYDDPPDLITDWAELNIQSRWDRNGRVAVRQVDPLPLTVLSITPIGYL